MELKDKDGTLQEVGAPPKPRAFVNPPNLTPMQAIVLAAIGGHLNYVTESGTPVDVRERASFVKGAVEEAAEKLNRGEQDVKLNMGVVEEYKHLRKMGAFKLDMGRKSIRDQILAAESIVEVNLVFANALLVKTNMEKRTWERIENARRVRLQELEAWAGQAKLSEGVR